MTGQYFQESNGGIARVTFRVRCESLGYGEAVILYPDDESSRVSANSKLILKLSLKWSEMQACTAPPLKAFNAFNQFSP